MSESQPDAPDESTTRISRSRQEFHQAGECNDNTEGGNEDEFCERCQRIEWDALLLASNASDGPQTQLDMTEPWIHDVGITQVTSHCPYCRFLGSLVPYDNTLGRRLHDVKEMLTIESYYHGP
jgi:hypothetical protein